MKKPFGPRLLAWLAVVLFAGGASAESEYWVSIASYSTLEGASEVRDRASDVFPHELIIEPLWSESGRLLYRVMAGPWADRAEAERVLQRAHATRYPDAWLLGPRASPHLEDTQAGPASAPAAVPAAVSAAAPAAAPAPETSTRPPGRATAATEQRDPAREAARRFAAPTVVERAPPGHQLHKLRRAPDDSQPRPK